jgi:hypothetical protein
MEPISIKRLGRVNSDYAECGSRADITSAYALADELAAELPIGFYRNPRNQLECLQYPWRCVVILSRNCGYSYLIAHARTGQGRYSQHEYGSERMALEALIAEMRNLPPN